MKAFDALLMAKQQNLASAQESIPINEPAAPAETLREVPNTRARIFSAGTGAVLLGVMLMALAAAVGALTGVSLFRGVERVAEEVVA